MWTTVCAPLWYETFGEGRLAQVQEFLETPSEVLDKMPGKRTYNISAMSFTPRTILEEIHKHYPDFKVDVRKFAI